MACWFVFFMAIAAVLNSSAARFDLTPVSDTGMIEWLPTNNLGKSVRLRTGSESLGRSRALVKFDLSGIAPTSQVVYARANFRMFYPPSPEGRTLAGLKIFRELRAWNESTGVGGLGSLETGNGASWLYAQGISAPWQEPGGKYAADYYYLESGYAGTSALEQGELASYRTRAVMEDAQKWISNPGTNYGWLVYNPGETAVACCRPDENGIPREFMEFTALEIASREDPANAPELVIGTGNPKAPIALIDDEYRDAPDFDLDAPGVLRFETLFPDGRIFYTLDGSRPTLASERYSLPVVLSGGEVIRAIAYSADYSSGGDELPPIRVRALPEFLLEYATSNGSQGTLEIKDAKVSVPIYNSTGSVLIVSNHLVTVKATPASGFHFARWSGDISGTESTVQFLMSEAISITANFEKNIPPGPPLTVRQVDGEFIVLQFPAEKQFNYRVQKSEDAATWTDFQNYTKRTGIVDTILPLQPGTSRMFYRLAVDSPGIVTPY
jgi:hypothetical protein